MHKSQGRGDNRMISVQTSQSLAKKNELFLAQKSRGLRENGKILAKNLRGLSEKDELLPQNFPRSKRDDELVAKKY